MDRKKAVIAAATIAGSLLAASSAYALTSGIVATGSDDGAGNLNPVVEVAPSDEPTTSLPPTVADGASSHPTDDDVGVDPNTPQVSDDNSDHEAEVEDHDSNEPDHEDDALEPHEFEGREDDD